MDRFQQPQVDRTATAVVRTPLTAAAQFTITKLDVGTEAVRPGLMASLEQDRAVLLLAAKLVLGRLRVGQVCIGAPYEHALAAAIAAVEAPK